MRERLDDADPTGPRDQAATAPEDREAPQEERPAPAGGDAAPGGTGRWSVVLLAALVVVAAVGLAWDALRGPDQPVLTADERAHLDEVAEEIDCQLDDGCLRWARELDEAWRDPPQLARAGDVAVASFDGRLTGWDIATGEQRWELAIDDPDTAQERGDDDPQEMGDPTPFDLEELGDGRIALWTGEQLWVIDAGGSVLARLTLSMRPLLHLDGDQLAVATPDLPMGPPPDDETMREPRGEVGVYDVDAQSWRWRRELHAAALDPLVVVDGARVAALDPDSGRARWTLEESFAAVTALDDAVAVGLPEGGVEVRALDDGAVRNRVPGHLRPVQQPTAGMPRLSGRLTIAVDEGRWRAIGADGEVRWQRDRPSSSAGEDTDDEIDQLVLPLVDVGHDLLLAPGPRGDGGPWQLLDLDTGRVAANVPDGASPSAGPMGSITMVTSTVMVSSGGGPAAAHDLDGDDQLWRTRGSRSDVAVDPDLGIVVTSDPTGLIALEID